MNVLVLNDVGFEPGGGTEAYCEMLARMNIKLGNKAVKVALGKVRGTHADVIALEGSNFPVVRAFYDKPLAKGLRKLCQDFKIDLVHANVLNARYAYSLSRVSHNLRLPLVLTVHTWVYLCPIEYNVMLPELIPCKGLSPNSHCVVCTISKAKLLSEPVTRAVLKIARMPYHIHAFKRALEEAVCIISPSKVFAAELYRRFSIKAHYIPNPVDWALLEERPKPDGDGSIVFLGRLEWGKGVQLLPHLAKSLGHVTVHIAGEGRLREWLLEHKPENIVYHGFVKREEKFELIRNASVVIVPSIWHEMFPNVVSEAFALAKPVVAFNIGGQKEQIQASSAGLLAKPFDINDFVKKVNWLLESPLQAMKMGLRGRKWVKRHLDPLYYEQTLAKIYTLMMEDDEKLNFNEIADQQRMLSVLSKQGGN